MKTEWTPGHQKLQYFLRDIVRKESFITDVGKIRQQFRIPRKGYVFPKGAGAIFEFPPRMKLTPAQEADFYENLRALARKHRMGPLRSLREPLAFIVVYGVVGLPDSYDLCAFEDVKDSSFSKRLYSEELLKDTHPLAIRVTPYASQRDIIAYIKAHYKKLIEPRQIRYREPNAQIGKKRKRSDSSYEVSDYVALHIGVPNREVVEIVKDNIGIDLDEGQVSKIKSLERRRRKK